MQFSRNRRILLAQDIVLLCLIPLLWFFTLGSVQIGKWNTGAVFTLDTTSTEISEDCLHEFYEMFTNAEGDELEKTIPFSPHGIWMDTVQGVSSLLQGIGNGDVNPNHIDDMPKDIFDRCAGFMVIPHIVSHTFTEAIYQGLLYAALFGITAALPVICIVQALCALIRFLKNRHDARKRHREVVLAFRRAVLPMFMILALSFMLPDVTVSTAWIIGIGLFLACVLWNFVASRVKRNTGNEKEFLNFVQILSFIGVILMSGFLVTLELTHVPAYLYDRIRYADGLEIILDCFEGNFDMAKMLMLLFIASFMVGIGLAIAYLYYVLLRASGLLESTRYKSVEKEYMIAHIVVTLLMFCSSYFLFEASGRLELVLEDFEVIAFHVMLGLLVLVLIVEIVLRGLCYVNRLDRECRNDLLCGRTDDRMYSVDAVIAETPEEALPAEAPAEEDRTTDFNF